MVAKVFTVPSLEVGISTDSSTDWDLAGARFTGIRVNIRLLGDVKGTSACAAVGTWITWNGLNAFLSH